MITDHFRKLKIAPSVIIQNLIKIELLIACENMVDKDWILFHLLTIATHLPITCKTKLERKGLDICFACDIFEGKPD